MYIADSIEYVWPQRWYEATKRSTKINVEGYSQVFVV